MADTKKSKGKASAAKKASDETKSSEAKAAEETEASETKSERVEEKAEAEAEHGHDDHAAHGAHGAHGAAKGHAHAHAPNIKEYMVIFAVLAALTVLEVGVAKVPGVSKVMMGLALVGLALTKAAIVALYYMHLKHETKVLKLTVALPMAAPTIYAIVLISEASWRLLRP